MNLNNENKNTIICKITSKYLNFDSDSEHHSDAHSNDDLSKA